MNETSGDLSPQAVREAISGGTDYLRSRQLRDGSWSEYPGYSPGTTALCVLALLSSGLDKNDPLIAKSLDFLRRPLTSSEYQTYPIALMTMVFCLADPERDRPLIQKNVDWLIERQFKTDNIFNGGWSYIGSHQPYNWVDNSNSQFAILALFEAERIGIKIPSPVWDSAEQYWIRMQNTDGSWGYRASLRELQVNQSGAGTGSMTCAGLGSLIICNGIRASKGAVTDGQQIQCCQEVDDETNKRIEKGLAWMAKHFSVENNPGTPIEVDSWVYYYLYGLERVGRLTAHRFIGNNDWYREGADFLLRRKGLFSKFWKAQTIDLKGNHAVATAFALLFLSKGRRPVLISKYNYGKDKQWNSHPNDLAHLTQYTEKEWKRDLIWQIVDANKATVDDLLQTPVLYLCGKESPLPEGADERRKVVRALRGYLEQGGVLVAESLTDDTSFEKGFFQMMKEVFPGQEEDFQLLPADHPIWSIEKLIEPEQIRPIYGIDFGCRTSVVYLPATTVAGKIRPSLSCLWEIASVRREEIPLTEGVCRQITAGLDLGLNILAYATNREMKYKEEIPSSMADELSKQDGLRKNIYVALLEHGGGSSCAPRAIPNLMKTIAREFALPVNPVVARITAESKQLFEYPVLFMHGRNAFRWTEAQRKNLRTFFDRNGFLFVNAICGSEAFRMSLEEELKSIFPDSPLIDIPADHPIFSDQFGGFSISKLEICKGTRLDGRKIQSVKTETLPELKGIQKDGRWIVVFSPYDVSCALEQSSSVECSGYTQESAFRLAVNILLYAME